MLVGFERLGLRSHSLVGAVLLCVAMVSLATADEYRLDRFQTVPLTDVYFSEGISFGDIDGDGANDIVYGPYWFAGPDFKTKHEIYPAQPQPRERYADNFFSWVHDFNGDKQPDVFVVGFPGTPASVYENPGPQNLDQLWTKHEVFDQVSNESPQFVDIVGDERPELICTRDGHFGYAVIDWQRPFEKWTFHKISEKVAPGPFSHGLGVGDINGDGRADVMTKDGWFAQPPKLKGDPLWTFHPAKFSGPGGADMFAYDVDGDGDNDVITSLEAHAYGLAWFEQVKEKGRITFERHLIMGREPDENRYGLVFTELHTVNLADMNGDGLKDIVTGKTYWSHHEQSPLWDAGAVVYWFELVRKPDGTVNWIPHKAADDTGVGRQVVVGDLNHDNLPDIVVGGMQGAHALLHEQQTVDKQAYLDAQPREIKRLAAGLSPEEAAAHMTVPEGFSVKLAAGEPQVHQPVAFAIDPRGRVWVAEAHTYPVRAPEGQGKDKIIILEDTTGDGVLDSRKVFIEGLNLVSGMEVGFGGVWVGAAPYLMFIPDKDGDDVPDGEPQILLDGFGYRDTHETLNAFIWGPDGWLYGCHGVFTYSNVGKPGTADDDRVPLNAGVWRYHPTRHEFEVFAWGTSNPWGLDFNDRGQAFITACVIPHLWHMIQGGRYQRQGGQHFNPHIYSDIQTIAKHRHYVGNIRDHAWWGKEPDVPQDTLAAGGGHAHCGAMIYLGDNWPEKYRNQIFMHNIHGNRMNNDALQRAGSGYVGDRAPDLMLANDKWFRGINMKYGPDGSVYVIDWYDRNACHRTNPEIWDRTNGRVYNISYGKPEWDHRDLRTLSDLELVELHNRENEWYPRTARRILQQRAAEGKLDAGVRKALFTILESTDDVALKLRAIWTLHVIGGLTDDDLQNFMQNDDEYIRGWAIQLGLENRQVSSRRLNQMADMAKSDPSAVVRLYLASALQRLPLEQRWPIARELVQHAEDSDDHNLPLMDWYGIEPLVTADTKRAMELAAATKIPIVKHFIIRRAASENGSLGAVTQLLAKTADASTQKLILGEMLQAFQGRVNIPMPESWKPAYDRLSNSSDRTVRDRADQVAVVLGDQRIFPRMRQQLVDPQEAMEKRQQALAILVRGRDQQAAEAFQAVLGEPELRGAAIRALVAFDNPKIAKSVLAEYGKLTEEERRDAINTLVARPGFAMVLLDAVEQQKVPRTDLHAYNVRQLLRFNNEKLNSRLKQVWGEIRDTSADKKALIARHKKLLSKKTLKASDASNGRRIFAKTCASCHTLFGEGGKIGPDITGSNRANLDYILENVLDPSAVMGKDYRLTVLVTVDGLVVSGLVKKETDSAVTIRTINDTVVVAKQDIEERMLSDQSMMPEGLLDPLKPEEVRDLIGYLASPHQVSLRGPRAPIDAKTGRVPDALEGESLKIIGKTAGNARSQPMGGFHADRWSGNDHFWWTGAGPGEKLELEIPVETAGAAELEIVLTRARDYGIVQLLWDGQKLGAPIDLYNAPDVVTTGVLSFPVSGLTPGNHKLTIEILGAHPKAAKAYMVGLDFVRLKTP
ncbi:FG-GAP repeat protein [Symmachiella dynata]|uniref:FG-GAP repeat protein n=1 Tax=Symmachiella dynata TaxID=2527995 RepID=A0A517ZND5_9PLAN|nr:PVC-type heme-binding CxxCH protein [Symmachiella dynata]QDU43993.1 FG-GAP repeat protein [Symmachiella dynata]